MTTPAQQARRGVNPWPGVITCAAAFAVLAIHTRRYLPFISDDALISLTYAKRLLQGHGLTWNGGAHVEGYSNLLWVLCAAALGALGVDLIDAVRVLGFAGMGAAMAAVVYANPPEDLKTALPTLIALLFLALSGTFAAWTIGGMEQPLVAGLLAWAVVLAYPRLEGRDAGAKQMLAPSLLLALLCLTRLDGPVFTAAFVAAIFLVGGLNRDSLRKAGGLALLPALFTLGQLAFRLAYYGEWIPNTALAKFNPSGKHALDGWGYLRAGAPAVTPLLALAAPAAFVCLRDNSRRARAALILVNFAAWAAYLVAIGGDIFPAWRHFVPLLLLLALLLAEGGAWLARRVDGRVFAGVVLAAALALVPFAFLQYKDEENFRAISERWEWDAEVVGTMLKKAFGPQQPLVAVDPAGGLPFWSELPALDMLGLNDYYLPRHPPPDLGQGPIAHELGDGQYVLNRRPDLVIFLLPTGNDSGYFLSGRQMQQDPRFFRDYTLVRFEGREPYTVTARIWVRKESERIGIRREQNAVSVPGFLICDNQTSIARLGADGRLVVPASQEQPARLNNFMLPAGRWRVEAEASPPALQLRVSQSLEG
ncbi:MAG: hypothetical protein M3416_21990, partial [Acidobacteriota bacterium]|nr:hypothetical protein [Acidobacteriota bacterium]